MVDEPRDNAPTDEAPDDDADELYDDEISLDELEGDTSSIFGSIGDLAPQLETAPQEDPEPALQGVGDDLDDEVTLDELDQDTAGFFEVYAAPAPPEPPPQATPAADAEQFEVEAAPAPPPPAPTASAAATRSDTDNIRRLHDVEVEVIATLGTTRMQIRDILGLQVGSVVELHRMVGEPVDVTLNGRLIARGEVVVVDEKFAIRVHEIVGNDD